MNNVKNSYELRKVQKVKNGGSLFIVLPKKYVVDLGIDVGDFVKVTQENDKIVVRKFDA